MNAEISKNPVIKLAEFVNARVFLALVGGRVLSGIVQNYDKYNNVILIDCSENYEDEAGLPAERSLGTVFTRGTMVLLLDHFYLGR